MQLIKDRRQGGLTEDQGDQTLCLRECGRLSWEVYHGLVLQARPAQVGWVPMSSLRSATR